VSRREGVPSNLLNRIVQLESGFRPCIVSPMGALGLMQLMPSTLRELKVDNPFDPVQNLTAGARFIKKLVSQFDGDWALALSAYNAGPAAVEFYSGVPPYEETIRFVADVLGTAPDLAEER
jgi:soluble lytic murein transglycosylase-like protein